MAWHPLGAKPLSEPMMAQINPSHGIIQGEQFNPAQFDLIPQHILPILAHIDFLSPMTCVKLSACVGPTPPAEVKTPKVG